MTTTRKATWAVVLVAAIAAGCGGAGDGVQGGGGTAGGPATVTGKVQGFSGGLVVNGVTFRTSGAALSADGGAPVALVGEGDVQAAVGAGDVVTVQGTLDDGGASGVATKVELRHLVEGEIASKGAGHVVVAGTAVSIDDTTVVADRHGNPLATDDLAVGTRIEVSGDADGRGGLRASSIRESADDAGAERELRAFVVAVSGTIVDLAFSPGGPVAVRVDVGGISPAASVSVGSFVEVRAVGPAGDGGVLTATSIHVEDSLSPRPADRVRVEGIVTALDASGFTVGAQRVVAGASTELRGGTVDDLVVGAGVEVEGVLRDDGVLVAHEVKFRPSARVEANAEAIDAGAGTFSVLGLAIHVSPSTELRNLASLAALPGGATVQVRGWPTRDGAGLNATRIEVLDAEPADRAFLRGVVSAKTPTSALEILGISVDTRAAEFRSQADAGLSAAAFFDAITTGQTIVKVRWRPYPASTSEPVEEAELEN
jgi:hypothetical protein